MLRPFLVFSGLIVSVELVKCPTGTVEGYFNSGCFLFVTKPLRWQQASDDCVRRGGQLATVPDSMSNTLLPSLAPTNCSHVYWLGGSVVRTAAGKPVWQWVDGTNFSNFTAWYATGKPTSSATTCLAYHLRTRMWYSEMCSSAKPYVCMLPPNAKSAGGPANADTCTAMTPMPNCEQGWSFFSRSRACFK
ncbi:Protein CLEC-53, partial [Aphelenchoides avenae]